MHALRTVFVCTLLSGTAALAQPVNDTCETALTLPAPTGFLRTRSAPSRLIDAGSAPEQAMSCQANVNSTVWYRFTPTASGRYEIQGCEDNAPSASAIDTVLAVYGGDCSALVELGNGCNDDWCSTRSRSVVELTAGTTYFLQVGKYSTAPSATDTVQLSVVKASGANDCSGTVPDLPLATSVPVATVTGDVNDAQVGGALACYTGVGHASLSAANALAAGRDVVHRFTATKTGTFSFRLSNSLRAIDGALYVTDNCTAAMTPPQIYSPPQCLSAANRQASSAVVQEEVTCLPLTQGQQVYVWVDEGAAQTSPAPGASFGLEVTECEREVEPNDTPATSAGLACGVTGAISPAGDIDFFTLPIPTTGDARVFAMAEAGASGVNQATSFNLQLRVTTSTATLEFDNDDLVDPWGSTAPGVAGTPLQQGVAQFLRVNHSTATSIAEPYRVYAVVQSGTAVPEVEPNGTTATALTAGSNYFSGTVTDTADVDYFAFQAPAGALVYLALDSQPARSSATATANHTLALWNENEELLLVNDGTTTANITVPPVTLDAGTPSGPSEHLLYRVPTAGTYFVRVGRTSTTVTAQRDYLLSIAIDCTTGGGIVAPTLASLTPTTGSSLGGELVTLTGTNFGAGSVVTFDGARADVQSYTSTTLVVRTPLGSDGPADVAVTHFGHPPATLAGAFTYSTPLLPPTVTSVTPAEGPTAGGATVTIRGSLFKSGAEVRFDVGGVVVPAPSVTVVNLSELTVVTPAHADGFATVTVRNPADNLEGSLANAYRFNAPPLITSVTPATGLTTGGTVVTLAGSGFRAGATVRFGTSFGTNVTVDPSGASLTVTTPAAALPGPVDLGVTNSDGQAHVRVDGFRYVLPAPTLSWVTPASGPTAGGTTITLTGTGFVSGPMVLVGADPASTVTLVSATEVTAVTPPGAAGVTTVRIINNDGQSATLNAGFIYVPPPTVSAISPTRGPMVGGTRITVTGADFQAGALVRIGGGPAFAAAMTNPSTITALTPSNMAGPADVEVVNPDGQRGVRVGAFTYDAAPVLSALTPSVGATSGGTLVTLTGSGFVGGAEVRFGTQVATGVMAVSATELIAVAPAAPMSVVTVSVTNPDGQSSSLPSAFRYVQAPTLASLTPDRGDTSGGAVVRLTGTGFGAETRVTFGAVRSPLVTLVDATTLDAVTPAHAPGAVDVSVSNPDGAQATLSAAFTFTRAAPVVSAVAPASGPVAGGTLIAISGSGFAPNVTVTVGGAPATDVVQASSELLRARVPAHAPGQVDVVVSNDDGQSVTATGAFTYLAAADGGEGVVSDGGTGGLGAPPDAGTGTTPTGCGCSGVEGSALMFAALGLLLKRRRTARS